MDAIVLVGGQGTRLRSVVADRPKPLADVGGLPFLDYLLAKIRGHVARIILATGYLGEQIAARYKKSCLISQEERPLGTGGSVCQALKLVRGERFWVFNGDSYFDLSLEEMSRCRADLVMACSYVEDVGRYGAVEIVEGRVVAFRERQRGCGWINGGIYLLHKALFEGCVSGTAFALEEALIPHLLLSQKDVRAYLSSGSFLDIGTPDSYREAPDLLCGGQEECRRY